MYLFNFFLLVLSSNYENNLRKNLFTNYSTDIIPKTINHALDVEIGLAVQTLEEFNQKVEAIELNIWVRMNWIDHRLEWNESEYNNISFIPSLVEPDKIAA